MWSDLAGPAGLAVLKYGRVDCIGLRCADVLAGDREQENTPSQINTHQHRLNKDKHTGGRRETVGEEEERKAEAKS